MEEEQVKEIENSILDRCTPHGGVVHILVDRKSTYVSAIIRNSEPEVLRCAFPSTIGLCVCVCGVCVCVCVHVCVCVCMCVCVCVCVCVLLHLEGPSRSREEPDIEKNTPFSLTVFS